MPECPVCHRTGFTEEELSAHQGAPACRPLSEKEALYHAMFTVKWHGPTLEALTAAGSELAKQQGERIAALEKAVADLTAKLAASPPSKTPGAPS